MCCTHQHRTAAHANTLHKLIFLVINMLISLQGPRRQSDSWGGSSSSKLSQRHHRDRRCPRAYQQSFQRQGCLHSTLLSIILVKRIWHIFCSAILLSLFFWCLAEGNILVEDIVKLASQTEENNEHEEVPRWCEQQAHSWLSELSGQFIFEGFDPVSSRQFHW